MSFGRRAGLHLMTALRTVASGLVMGESPRWHAGRVWFADWMAQEVVAVDADGTSRVMLTVQSLPISIDWMPDGRLLAVSGSDRLLLRREVDGAMEVHADLSTVSRYAHVASDELHDAAATIAARAGL